MDARSSASERKADSTDYARRRRVNIIAAIGITGLAALSYFAVKAFFDYEKLGNCVASGRRNCVEMKAPPREGIFIPSR